MFKINRKTEYGLMALEFLHNSRGPQSVRSMSDELSIPFDTLSHVLQRLSKIDFVESIKGVNGGYQLKGSLEKLSYLHLCETIEKKSFFKDCDELACDYLHTCNIQGPVNTLNKKIKDYLGSIKIKDILEEKIA